ncbi:TMEM175 family protein [Micromonospora sp. WMMA1998]|uniref:TMEM175 family protein n=1 Tax=Micromonospora sp. WMMA1998 TaxID=3015167 RepID=UPI00248D2179|nr:TMEM175 family protein [Micromonospora sp. WMMA1998]WBC17610.1 TMEM175 family protein [Micromonospora sp. WMMA1998]
MAAGRDPGDVDEVEIEAGLRSDTARAIGFSDAVFAIVITLLVLDLRVPESAPGGMLHALLDQWPVYLAYVTSYLYVAVNWLNHKGTFHRVRCADRGLHWANLGVLFSVALLPFVTALVSRAVEQGDTFDERVAVAAYAVVGVVLSAAWLWLYHYLSRHRELLQAGVTARFFAAERVRAALGVAAYAIAGGVGWWVSVPVALVVLLLLPLFYGLSSNGSYDLLRRLRHRR